MRLDLPIPDGLRYGQALFGFLCWLAQSERVSKTMICYMGKTKDPATGEHFHMADPFNIPDEQFERWWAEWLDEKFPSLSSDF